MKAFQDERQHGLPSSPEQFRTLAIRHLNRIYCVRSHISERLQDLIGQSDFAGLQVALVETQLSVEQQLARLYGIYLLMDSVPAMTGCDELTELMESDYATIYGQFAGPVFRDLAVLFYLQTAESAAMISFRLLRLLAAQMGNERLQGLLAEICDGVVAYPLLFSAITEKHGDAYFGNQDI